MIINHNLGAMNAQRQMSTNQNNMSDSMEKLSSGLRINRAGDDAAGLAISEKMRGQIRGLEQANRNAQDGVSMIQTAEGALNETHSILQRMRELAVQSSNDTNTQTDRGELQKEIDQLSQEITRIGEDTEFNTQNLLNGSFEGSFQIGANEGQSLSLEINDMRSEALGVTGDAKIGTSADVETTDVNTDIADGDYTVKAKEGTYSLVNENGQTVATSADGLAYASSAGDDTINFDEKVVDGKVSIASGTATAEGTVDNQGLKSGDYSLNFASGASTISNSDGEVIATSTNDKTFEDVEGNTVLTLNTAATADADFSVKGIDISTQESADASITTLNSAIESVSAERSKLGAYQNRLEHTVNNLGTSAENLQSAESRIRDVDMAKEMMNMTKNNILSQASQSMLAQANQQPQSVLQLLQ